MKTKILWWLSIKLDRVQSWLRTKAALGTICQILREKDESTFDVDDKSKLQDVTVANAVHGREAMREAGVKLPRTAVTPAVETVYIGREIQYTKEQERLRRLGVKDEKITELMKALVERASKACALCGAPCCKAFGTPTGEKYPWVRLPVGPSSCTALGDDNRCQVYAERPWGCKEFICSSVAFNGRPPTHDEYMAFIDDGDGGRRQAHEELRIAWLRAPGAIMGWMEALAKVKAEAIEAAVFGCDKDLALTVAQVVTGKEIQPQQAEEKDEATLHD